MCNFFVQGCRNVEAGELVKKVMKSRGPVSGEVTCLQLDVGSFKSIKTFAELVLERFPRIDLLVNNGMYVLLTFFRKWEGVVGTGWSWLRIGTGGGHL